MNRRRLRILFLLAGVALAVVAFGVWPRGPREPAYKGRTLSQWIHGAHDIGVFEQSDETKAAMAAMNPDAVPFLLSEFTRPFSRWRRRLGGGVNRLRFPGIHFRTDDERLQLAGQGLMLLETNAAQALPVLVRYVEDPVRGGFAKSILSALEGAARTNVLQAASPVRE